MMVSARFVLYGIIIASIGVEFSRGFVISERNSARQSSFLRVARYGPPDSSPGSSKSADDDDRTKLKSQFRSLLSQSMRSESPQHLPRLLANNIELVFSLRGHEGTEVISEILEEAKADGPKQFHRTVKTIETILSFAEDFVSEASQLDGQNKKLLGKIIVTMTSKENSDRDREELLDKVMEEERDNFTPGFLNHLEGECSRIANAPKITPESSRLLEIMRMIQARVLEELGQGLGEAALVLGQLMGYDDESELLGVLDAGLTVRGREFAIEMSDLTKEALDGFKKVPGGVDPDLVERVTFIDTRLSSFLDNNRATP